MDNGLPSGTVTFVLTDVVGSTRAWESAPVQMDRAIARHAELIEQAVVRNGGIVLKSRGEGDSTFSVFDRPSAAVAATMEAQLALGRESREAALFPEVRISVHTGEAAERDGDYFGPVVNRAARLRSIAKGGQVLLSATTAALVEDAMPDGAALVDTGEVHLRDLDRAERVFLLTCDGLEADQRETERPRPPVLDIRLLGPVEVLVDGDSVNVGGPKERTLLAALALDGGPVRLERLVVALWDDDPPPTARKTLQTYAWRVRRVLTEDTLRRVADGYELCADSDVQRFRGAVAAADAHLRSGDPTTALARLDAALQMWRGAPLGGCLPTTSIEAHRRELEEVRAVAVELRAAASLDLGHSNRAIAELERLVGEHPHRERRWHLLALALYRSGRQGDALSALQRARTALLEDLGVDPGLELLQLEQAILEHRPELHDASALPGVEQPEAQPKRVSRRRPPAPSTPLVGRAAERAEVLSLLSDHRLVTITGTGGVGKTCLAVDVASHLGAIVAFCDLSPLSRAGGVHQALAHAVGVDAHERRAMGSDLVDAVTERLGVDAALILVDNCEHLIDEVALTVECVLARCPSVQVLATSRQPLGLPGEQVALLAPLSLPIDDDDVDASAVELLTRRAREANSEFEVDSTNRAAIAEICRRVEGVPLALELAAARLSHMTANEVAARLYAPLRLLTGGRTGDARHRGLAATIEWSHRLLTIEEACLFRRLAVFSGRFDLADVEACCVAGLAPTEGLDLLGALVERSLVVAEPGHETTRYRLLHVIREFAAQQLAESEDEEQVREAHCRWFLSRLELIPLDRRLLDTRRRPLLLDVREDVSNAIEWADSRGHPDMVARLTASMFAEWQATDAEEINRWLPVAVEYETSQPPSQRLATAVSHLLYLFQWDGDREALRRHRLRLAALAENIHDEALSALVHATLASFASRVPGEVHLWQQYAERAIEKAPAGAATLRAMAWSQLARSLLFQRCYEDAVTVLTRAAAELGPEAVGYIFSPQVDLVLADHLRGRHDLVLAEEASLFPSVGAEGRWDLSVYASLSTAALGDADQARDRLAATIATERTSSLPRSMNDCRVAVGALLCLEQRWDDAARLLAPLQTGATSYNHIGVLLEHYRTIASEAVPHETWQRATVDETGDDRSVIQRVLGVEESPSSS